MKFTGAKVKENKGFTLIEMMAIIIILGILIMIAIPAINNQLANMRKDYYQKLEDTVKSGGQDYITDKRYARPTKLLYSKVVKVDKLEDEGYIEEVKDYLGNKCDSTDTSYSYVVAVKVADKTFDYAACLKCSKDEYVTDTTEKEKDLCNEAWLTDEGVEYVKPEMKDELMYVYYGTTEQEIKEQVGITYDVIKKDKKGNILARVENTEAEEKDILYPQNIGELVGKNVNTTVNLRYILPDGTTLVRKAVIYKHNAPKITMRYRNDNVSTGKKKNDLYLNGPSEWSNGVDVRVDFSDKDNADIKEAINFKTVEYYNPTTARWEDTKCTLASDKKSCTWHITQAFNKSVKFRLVNDHDRTSDEGNDYSIKVEITNPTCTVTPSGNLGENSWYISNATMTLATADTGDSGVGTYGLTTATTPTYNKVKTGTQTDTKGTTWYGYVADNAGNTGSCNKSVKVDTIKPTITNFTAASTVTTHNALDVNLSIAASDVNAMKMMVANTSDYAGVSWENYATTKKWKLTGTPDGVDRTVYLKVKDDAGNTTTKTTTYKPYKTCTEKTTTAGEWGTWGACSVVCGTGTQTRTRTVTEKDKYYSTTTCGTKTETGSQSCTANGCCDKTEVESYGTWSNWGACSKACGTGTQTRTRTNTLRSAYDHKTPCGTTVETGSQSCNTMNCCDKTEVASNGSWGNWTQCSKNCGGGTRSHTRTNNLRSAYDHKTSCGTANETASESCNTGSCCASTKNTYSAWSAWSACSRSCGGGTQTHTRTKYTISALDNTTTCAAATTETASQSCNTGKCSCTYSGNGSSSSAWTTSRTVTCSCVYYSNSATYTTTGSKSLAVTNSNGCTFTVYNVDNTASIATSGWHSANPSVKCDGNWYEKYYQFNVSIGKSGANTDKSYLKANSKTKYWKSGAQQNMGAGCFAFGNSHFYYRRSTKVYPPKGYVCNKAGKCASASF